VLRQVRVTPAFRRNAFKVVFACKPKQLLAIAFDVVAVQEAFALLRHDPVQPKLAVG